ncbi:MAG: glycine reductase [Tissierellia bacterium]|nr:glycine reductase [Tissierellia bacterium]
MFPVLKAASYILAHTPEMVLNNGTTQTTEKIVNPESEYLKKVSSSLRSFDEVVSYPPNQCYIGNITPDELKEMGMPWVGKAVEGASTLGKKGEIYPEDVFIAMIKAADAFGLVILEKEFTEAVRPKLEGYKINEKMKNLPAGVELAKIEEEIEKRGAEALLFEGKIVGCVERAHDIDVNLNAHVIFENLVVKASGAMAMERLFTLNNIDPKDVDYVIECSEEACGDMNQRGGGNFAKSIAEMTDCMNATGSDTRGFCAAPAHTLIQAAALVKAGVYKNVVIAAGGATAKLGMNGKNHVEKGLPILEDAVAGFAALISENDGVNPIIRTDIVGGHTVGTGSSPQNVTGALTTSVLDKAGLSIKDIDRYSVEMQNPDITVPAGAGDVPTANYKMIAALGVMRKDLERSEINDFVANHGMVGWAPTQGHIPSGVPYLGFAIDDITSGKINRAMIVGKGSLFLGRMTNLFDGVSVVIEKNPGLQEEEGSISKEEIRSMVAEAMRDFAASLNQ